MKIFKPKGTLKAEDKYKTKIELASEILTELIESGFNIKLVLADSFYGEQVCAEACVPERSSTETGGFPPQDFATLRESSQFIRKLDEYKLDYVVAIRSNHGVWWRSSQCVRANKWCKFERTFNNQSSETR